jgi:DNA-binding winged helix-turn-helix (wHTH) protein
MLLAPRFLISDSFRFEVSTRDLFRIESDGSATPLPLGSRAAEVLLLFLRRPGELVTKDELMEAVWPNTAVEDNNLRVQILAVRRALDTDRDGGSAISTVPGRGYRFTLPVQREEERETDPSISAVAPLMLDAVAAHPNGFNQIPTLAHSLPIQSKAIAATVAQNRLGRAVKWMLLGICGAAALVTIVVVVVEPNAQPKFELSGVWQGDDGGVYTISQSGMQVTWEGISGDGGVRWTHTFKGEIQGKMVVGRFFNHPPGQNHNAGRLTLEIVDNSRFEKVAAVGGFYGSVWTRKPAVGR